MENYNRRIFVRLSGEEHARAMQLAASLDMTLSELVRILLELASTNESAVADGSAIVIDTTSAARIAREMRHWGYQYNQAVHALNRLAYFLERGKADRIDAVEVLSDVSIRLGMLDASIKELASSASEIAGRDLVYR